MAKIVRYNGNLQAFASAAIGTERTLFGEVTQANDLTSQFTADFLRGWGIVGPSDQPTLEDFNGAMYTNGQLSAYLHQMGIAEYNAAQEYHTGSLCNVAGVVYSSLIDTNVGNTPASSPAQWAELYRQATELVRGIAAVATQAQAEAAASDSVMMTPLKTLQAITSKTFSHGQCRLTFINATSIRLDPKDGNRLVIAGVSRPIPAAGVTLSNGSMSASTLYYVYAFWNGSAVTLEFSATGHSVDATTGVEIKTGDATRSLVGMVYTNASSQFANAPATRHVASWFNRRSVGAMIATSAQTNFTTTTFVEVSTTHRVSFLTWGDEAVDVKAAGQMIHGTAGQSVSAQSFVDGIAYGNVSSVYESSANAGQTFASTNTLPFSGTSLAEGQHIAQLYGAVTAGGGAITQLANSVMTRI